MWLSSTSVRLHFRRLWAAYGILAISLAITAVGFVRSVKHVDARRRDAFENQITLTLDRMEVFFTHYQALLDGLKGFFEAHASVSPEEFKRYLDGTRMARDRRGLLDVGFALRVPAAKRLEHIAAMKQFGMANYHPTLDGDEPDFFPMVYLQDFSSEEVRSGGWNAWADPVRRAAMELARDTGEPVASQKTRLLTVGGQEDLHGFVVFLPVYRPGDDLASVEQRRERLVGFVFESFVSQRLWEAILRDEQRMRVDLEVFDLPEGFTLRRAALLFDSDGVLRGADDVPANLPAKLKTTLSTDGLGRSWGLHLESLAQLEEAVDAQVPWLTLGGGVLVSGALFGLGWTQARARTRTERLLADLRASDSALRNSESRFRHVFESIQDVYLQTDADGRVVLVSPSCRQLGYEPEELVGREAGVLYARPGERDRLLERLRRHGVVRDHEVVLRRKTGESVMGSMSAQLRRDAGGRFAGTEGLFRDITERLKLEEERQRASRLEAVGVLAGGIAHDFNNSLTAILGNVSIARMDAAHLPEVSAGLADAEKACLRARELTRQLLTFARGGAPVKETALLTSVIRDSARFVTPGSHVHCAFQFAGDLWAVEADTGQISQVIQNIVLNAVQAMPNGGTITITAENHVADASNHGSPLRGRYVRISIRDEGVGIRPEDLPRIFDPYFTTKHQGTGLGLATAYSIVQRHAGHISVTSAINAGTSFVIYLPASDRTVMVEPRSMTPVPAGQGRILVMDDDEMVLRFANSLLKKLGYEPLLAREGSEAASVYRRSLETGETIGAVILDLTVPGGLGGKETIKLLAAMDPHVRAIVSSGYSNDPVMAEHREYGFRGVVSKPYTVEQLAKVLHEVLNGARG